MKPHLIVVLLAIPIAACAPIVAPTTGYSGPTGAMEGEYLAVAAVFDPAGTSSSDLCEGSVALEIDKFGQLTGTADCAYRIDGFNQLFCDEITEGEYLCSRELEGTISDGLIDGLWTEGDGAFGRYTGYFWDNGGQKQLHGEAGGSLELANESGEPSLAYFGLSFEALAL